MPNITNKFISTGGMSVALKNIINSMYSEDLSKKVCAAQKIKAKNGDVVQALVHFGYMKDPNDIHKIIIDPEAAQIVRKIFAYAEEITNASEIARRLNVFRCPYCKRTLSINNKSVSCSMKTVSLNSECNKVFANKETLEDTVATTINQIAAYAMDCSQKLMKKSRTCDIIEGDIIAYQKELQSIPMLKMRKYDQYKQEKITAEQYQAFVEEVYIKKEQLEDKLKQLYEEQNAMKTSYKEAEHTHLLANSMLLRNGYDAEIISRFVKYIDVYSESEIEIVFNVDDVFFKKILDELE